MLSIFKRKIHLEDQIHLIQTGDKDLREKVIEDFFPFIINTLSDVLNRFIEVENDPYLSFGLEAFNKALDTYDSSKGKFITFAKAVIRNKVFDELRKEQKETYDLVEEKVLDQSTSVDIFEIFDNENEVFIFRKILESLNINFDMLIDESPKHKSVRLDVIKAGVTLSKNPILMKQLFEKGKLPRSKLMTLTGLSLKQIRYHRNFIIAVAVAMKEDLTFICNYIHEVGGEYIS